MSRVALEPPERRTPVAHHLGRLALLRHDRCRGEELLRRAVELSECFRPPQFAARSRADLARLG